jgi:hypothetical protein
VAPNPRPLLVTHCAEQTDELVGVTMDVTNHVVAAHRPILADDGDVIDLHATLGE